MSRWIECEVRCPYCLEEITVFVDPAGGETQRTVSDCDVCCRPIELEIRLGEDPETDTSIQARRGDEGHF